jgi:hypothetical protein
MSKNENGYLRHHTLPPKGIYLFGEDKNSENTPPTQQLASFEGINPNKSDINGFPYCVFKTFNDQAIVEASVGQLRATLNNQKVLESVQERDPDRQGHLHAADRALIQNTFSRAVSCALNKPPLPVYEDKNANDQKIVKLQTPAQNAEQPKVLAVGQP